MSCGPGRQHGQAPGRCTTVTRARDRHRERRGDTGAEMDA